MINILEILKKMPNLEDMVFYSPLYGDVKITIEESNTYPIELYTPEVDIADATFLNGITRDGYFEESSYGERELMIYPSRENRNWNKFLKNLRPDLPENTSVMVSFDKIDWSLRMYSKNSFTYALFNEDIEEDWDYIVPTNKFNFDNWSFKEEDNYGTAYKS